MVTSASPTSERYYEKEERWLQLHDHINSTSVKTTRGGKKERCTGGLVVVLCDKVVA